jgi:uncharacterized protein (TIGR02246 family)
MKKQPLKFSSIILLFNLIFLFAYNSVVAQNKSATDKEVEKVREAFNSMVRGFNARDAKQAVSYFAEDLLLVHPLRGEADYKAVSEGFEKAFRTPLENPYTILTDIEEIQVSGDMAFIRVIWSRESVADKQILSGEKDVEIWQRQKDGKWKLARGYSFPLKTDAPNWTKEDAKIGANANYSLNRLSVKNNSAEDIKAIQASLEKVRQSYNNRDLTIRMSLYADNSLLTYPGQPDADYNQTRKNYENVFANRPAFPINIFYKIEEIKTSGDLAFIRMMWFVERDSDKQILSRLKDLEIWQRQKDGTWKLARGLSFHLKPHEPNATKN